MALSNELISQFAKVVTKRESTPSVTTVNGTAKLYDGKIYVQIDGSNGQLTPIASSTAGMEDGDRVTVQIKNHSATILGNASDPSAGMSYADMINGKVDAANNELIIVKDLVAEKANVTDLNATTARIEELEADNVTINGKLDAAEADIGELVTDNATIKDRLTATEADIGNLEADNVTISGKLEATEAEIETIKADFVKTSYLEANYATIANLEATNADIHDLEADYGDFKSLTTDNLAAVEADIGTLNANKLNVTDAKLQYANIDFANIGQAAIENFFSKSGMIEDLVVSSGTITGQLVGVTISGDLIEGNTIKADKLVVLGEDGLYYKLNVNAETVSGEQTEYNSINGSIITANTITAEKINVDDLVAFDATIGGFKIGTDSIYSGVKSSVDNTTRGVYMDDEGQFALGDTNNYLKYYKVVESDGSVSWKLDLSAQSIHIGTGDKTLEETIADMQDQIDNVDLSGLNIGGRNLIRNSKTLIFEDYTLADTNPAYFIMGWNNPIMLVTSDGYDQACDVNFTSGWGTYDPNFESMSYNVTMTINEVYDATGPIYITRNGYDEYYKPTDFVTSANTQGTPQLNYTYDGSGIIRIDPPTGESWDVATTYEIKARYSTPRTGNEDMTNDQYSTLTANETACPPQTEGPSAEFDFPLRTGSNNGESTFTFSNILYPGLEYTLSFWLSARTSEDLNTTLTIGDEEFIVQSWKKIVRTFTAESSDLVFTFNYVEHGGCYINNAKLELGNIATDWTPAPEDLNDTTDRIEGDISNIESTQAAFSKKFIDLDATKTDWTLNFREINGFINNENGEFDFSVQNSILKYIKFIDGDIWLGRDPDIGEDDFKCVISNEKISFLQNNSEVAYISNNRLYITNATVTTKLDIGKFSFMPRDNGNMSFKFIG